MSLVFAVIAALVIMLAGLLSDARLVTVLLRCVAGFLVAGVCVWLTAMILEHQNIVGFDRIWSCLTRKNRIRSKVRKNLRLKTRMMPLTP